MAKPNPVVHFEMGYKDKGRMTAFYQTVFGWDTQDMGPNMGGYVVAHTTETDKDGMVKTPGNINGGFYEKGDDAGMQAPSVVVSVDDINASVEEVKKAGGKILGAMGPDGQRHPEPQMIPGVGLWMPIEDTEGNRLSLLQPA